VREGGRIVAVAAMIAVAANTHGRRNSVGLRIAASEALGPWPLSFWRGLRGVKRVVSDSPPERRDPAGQMRNALAHGPCGPHTVVAAALRQAFIRPDRKSAGEIWRQVADQLRPCRPKRAVRMERAEHDGLACLTPPQHRTGLHGTNCQD
jgi:transposase-like protein